MKTTIEINDALLTRTKEIAAQEGSSVRSLVEEALRRLLEDRLQRPAEFRLRDASVDGGGLRRDVTHLGWEGLIALAYEDPGEPERHGAGQLPDVDTAPAHRS